jgi:NADH-quinone oxidoreductase subunit L
LIGLLPAIPALPLLGALACLGGGKGLRWSGGEWVVGTTALALVALGLLYGQHGTLQVSWLQSAGFEVTAGLELNDLTWSAAVLVAGVSLPVALYAMGYMRGTEEAPRFFATLSLFIGAMLVLVLASSLALLYAAWEAIGVASYLLIGFRRREDTAAPAATQALLMTRVTDMAFLLGWLLALGLLHTTDIDALLRAAGHGQSHREMLTIAALLMFVDCIGKSAQLPLSGWLSDAMVAPTPVSALLHSATMVAAGVFLLLRLYPLFAASPGVLEAMFWVGAVTAIFGALAALGETDLKRLLAWSTSSHLGGMILAIGLGAPFAAAAQLLTHALAKSTLFLAAGAVERQTGTRDLRRLRALGRVLPVTTLAFALGALALVGFQPFPLVSSDEVALAAALHTGWAPAALAVGLLFLSGLYIARGGAAVFGGEAPSLDIARPKGNPPMLVGMIVLATAAVLAGLLLGGVARLLPFGAELGIGWSWRLLATTAAIAGLTLGAWPMSKRYGEFAIERLSGGLQWGLRACTGLPARYVLAIARSTDAIERGLDALSRGVADATWSLGINVDRVEQRGFAAAGDCIAHTLQRSGEALRRLETGKLYWYLLILFLGSIAVMIAGGLLPGTA